MPKTPKTRRPIGRPSKYDPAYCDRVVTEMAEGKSLTAFAAEISVTRSSINEWMAEHPEFSEAVRIGKAKCAAWWEARGRDIARNGGGPGSSTLVVFGLKNMGADDWRDKQEVEHSGQVSYLMEVPPEAPTSKDWEGSQ